MTAIIIILIVGLLIYFATRKKKNTSTPTIKSSSNFKDTKGSQQLTQTKQQFQSKISSLKFPDRVETIVWHINAINKGLANGDLNLANISYAKLIESIRQQNINENGNYEFELNTIRDEYSEFRQAYGFEYPQQFLSPTERKKKEAAQTVTNDTLIYLETLNFEELPKSVIKHLDIVRTISQWNELGFKPKKKDEYGGWNDIKRENRYFEFVEASSTNPRHKISFETGKRITSKPYYIKALVDQGISLDEFIDNGDDLKHFINADNFFEEKNYEQALQQIELAISLRPLQDYKELKKEIQIKLGNEDIAEQKFKEYEYDIDTAVHTEEIYNWFKVLTRNKKYDKVIFYIQKTDETLDKLSKGIIKPKIYGQQSGDWYLGKKEEFNKNLYRIFDLDISSLEKTDDSVKMLALFITIYIGKEIKPIESIADIYVKWNLKDEAFRLYKLCLDRIANEDKPRVKTRLNKKITDLTT